jgi:Tol biopolymer transport system component
MPLQGGGKPHPYIATPFNELTAQFSPDGRWVAYTAYDSGGPDVYVQPYPANGERYTISVGGGVQPSWRRDGRELFYLTPTGALKAVPVETRGNELKTGRPQSLFEFDMSGRDTAQRLYQASADGQRFLITERFRKTDSAAVEPLTVVVNWAADLERSR